MDVADSMNGNTPYWWEQAPPVIQPTLPVKSSFDVAIVGAGYAGLAAGLALSRAGRAVAAFDAMNPGEGASSRNGGITSGNIRPGFDLLVDRFGADTALAIEAEGKTAREFLGDFVRTEQLDCDYQSTGLFTGAIGFGQYEAMARGVERLAQRLGIEAYAVPYSEQSRYVGSDFYRGGVARMDIGGLHPAKFHRELLRVSCAAGLSVYANTPVLGIQWAKVGFRIRTSQGIVEAAKVLVCTNGYTDAALPFLRRRLVPIRSRMIATGMLSAELMSRLMPKGMMMGEALQLGYYYRPSPDGTRILLGGRDGARDGDHQGPISRLRDGLVTRFPELRNVQLTHSWFGSVAMNRDLLPRLFEHDGVLYATGFCGSGVVWAPWLGTRAAYRLLGQAEAGQTAFSFGPPAAVPLYRGKPWFIPAVLAGYRLQDRLALWRSRR